MLLITPYFLGCISAGQHELSDPKKDGYVPNEETAIRIAEAVWLPIYGEQIRDEKPFHATLLNDSIWVVEGTIKNVSLGGTVYAEILKRNAKIVRITHYK